MNSFRFHLQKYHRGSKITCPACGRKACFTRYVDEEAEIHFPEHVGKCDHENRCGYHFSPKDFFNESPDAKLLLKSAINSHALPITIKPMPVISYIDPLIVEKSLSHYEINPLYIYLTSILGETKAKRLMERYQVGTSSK
jgi:hypothetical protein